MHWPAPYVLSVVLGLLVAQTGCRGGILNCQVDPDDPFQDWWQERSSISCQDESETAGRIAEIIFCQGRFGVTWTPFETYVDYWGDYTLDPETNELTMNVTGGNFIPDDTDLQGTAEFQDDGSVLLRDIYLGTRNADTVPTDNADTPIGPACGHILESR